jgi:hypothetical protein
MSIQKKYANITLPAEDVVAYDAAIVIAHDKMAILPEEETPLVKHLAKIGNKSESFAREALALGKQHTGLLPRDLDLTTMERTLQNRDVLRVRLATARHLVDRLEAAIVLLGVDCYRDGLDIYNALKRGGTTQSLRDAVRELGRTFRRTQAEEETPEPTEPEPEEPVITA